MEYFPVVVQVVPQENYHVHVYFEDGKIVDYDATELLEVLGKEESLRRINAAVEKLS